MSPLEELPVRVLKVRKIATQEYENVLVDGDYDGEYLAGFNWIILKSGHVRMGYAQTDDTDTFESNKTYLHQVVLRPKEGYWTHFKNGNKLDCRSANLEYMTPKEIIKIRDDKWGALNNRRTFIKSDGTKGFYPHGSVRKRGVATSSKYRGVMRATSRYKGKTYTHGWKVQMDNRQYGGFRSEEDAARWYDRLAKKKYEDKAILNFPEES